MSRLSSYLKDKMVKVLAAVLVVGTIAGNDGITAQAAELNVADPFQFAIYTNEYSNTGAYAGNHVEGNVAIGSFGEVKSNEFVVYEGESYVGDFSSNTAKVRFNVSKCTLVLPKMNTDGTANELVNNGGNWTFNIKNGDTVIRSFEAGNCLQSYEYRDNILQTIADTMEGIKGISANLYALDDCDTEQMYVINLTAEQFRNGAGSGNRDGGLFCKIKAAARSGKTVVVNIPDEVVDLGWCWMNASAEDSNGQYAAYASNIFWNFGNATSVKVAEIMGNILAPNATVQNDGNVVGSVIANKVVQNGEVHKTHGTVPTPPSPSPKPTVAPTTEPTAEPTMAPTTEPTVAPTTEPTAEPTVAPTTEPTAEPTVAPTTEPTAEPTVAPTTEPTAEPTVAPTTEPTAEPTVAPTNTPDNNSTPAPTADDPGTSDDPGTPDDPTDPGTTTDTVTPEVLGERRHKVVKIEDDPTTLSDRAVLGASRRPQTGDNSNIWSICFVLSLTGAGVWFAFKNKKR